MNLHLRKCLSGAFALSLLLCLAVGLMGQGTQATFDGQVTDSAGAAVKGARITVLNTQTGVATVGVSGDDGYYHIGSLNPGQYSITVEQPSFTTSVRNGIDLEVAQHATVNFALVPGSVTQSVTVTGDAAQLQTQTSDQSEAIDQQRILTLPTQGHNPIAGVFSVPGVAVTAADQRLRAFDIAGTTGTSINGSPSGTNEILVDGMSTIYDASSASYIPTVESTSEVRVQTTNFDASYGWTLGGVINMLTQSGTNQFHGAAWEYFQNTIFDANTFGDNFGHQPRPSSHLNTFGVNFGGPILRNKLFAEYTFEDLRQSIPDPFTVSVPTNLQKMGDFSQTYNADGTLDVIYDPYSTYTAMNGSLQRNPVPGNNLNNLSRPLDPVALKVLSYIPTGNAPGNPTTGLGNYVNGPTSRKFTDFFPENTIRVDYAINPTTRMFVRYSHNALQEERGFIYSTTSGLNPADTAANVPFTRENHNATAQFTKILNNSTVLTGRIGFERFKSESGDTEGNGPWPGTLGFAQAFTAEAGNWFPTFAWANYNGAGISPTNVTTAYDYLAGASLAKSIGPYNLTIGVDLRLLRSNSQNPGYSAGQFSFDQGFTGSNPSQITADSGNAIASFLEGTPASGEIQINSEPAREEKLASIYMQNDFRAAKNLTLNLGLRWDYLGPLTDRFNGLASFDPEAPNPLPVPGQSLYGGLVFAGVNGQPRGITYQSWGDFGPRAGMSYQIERNTVLHAGYGLIYGQSFDDPGEAPGFSQTTTMVTSISQGVPYNTLDNPFPSGVLKPTYASQGLETDLGESFSYADPNERAAYVQQFALALQHQLPKDFLVSATYIGTRFGRLPVSHQINAIPLSAVGLGAAALQQQVANPFAGLLPGTALNSSTVQRQQLLAPYPQFLVGSITGTSGITEEFIPIGTSSYNAGQFLVQKRLSYGLDFTVEYTVSKQLDQKIFANPQDTHLEKVIAAWDIPRNMQINLLWQLPFGSGRALGNHILRPARWAISGWDFSSLTRLQAGMPLDLTSNPNSVPIGNPKLAHPSLSRWFNTCTLGSPGTCQAGETPVWAVRAADQLQTWKTRLANVRLPGVHNSDISVAKNNQITQRVNLIFRTDFINAFNSPQFFSGPNSNVTSGSFGEIQGYEDQSNLPRFVQFSMKAQF